MRSGRGWGHERSGAEMLHFRHRVVLAAVVGCQGPPPSIGHFNLIGFDEGGHHAASPATVAPCSTEERDLAFEDTVAYLHTDDDERVRPTAACCTPHANRWDFLLSPYPEHGHRAESSGGSATASSTSSTSTPSARRFANESSAWGSLGDEHRAASNSVPRRSRNGGGDLLGAVTPTTSRSRPSSSRPRRSYSRGRSFDRRSWVQRVSGTTRSLRRSSRSAASDGSPSDPSARSASIVGATPRWSVPERTSRATGLACASSTRGSRSSTWMGAARGASMHARRRVAPNGSTATTARSTSRRTR